MTPRIASLLSRHDYLETVIRSHADQIHDKAACADELRANFPALGRAFHAVAKALHDEGWPLPDITDVPWDDFYRATVAVSRSHCCGGVRGAFRTHADLSPPVQD